MWLLLLGACKAGKGEPCPDPSACSSELTCLEGTCRDPASFCHDEPAHATRCERDGRCTLVDGACVAASTEDCAQSSRCKDHGACNFVGPCCSRDNVCVGDEEDPLTYVDRLADPNQREAALAKLTILYDSALALDGGDRAGAHAGPMLGEIVPGLAELATTNDLPIATRAAVLQLLARGEHPAATDAFLQAVREHRVDEGQPSPVDAAMSHVLAAVANMRIEGAKDAAFKLFKALHASSKKAQIEGFSRSLQRAVVGLADKSWEQELIAMLSEPVNPRGDFKRWRDQRYWQITAAKVLGRMRSQAAIEPLMKVLLSPMKSDIRPSALEALVRIGAPVVGVAEAALRGDHEGLVAHAREQHRLAVAKDVGDVADRSADQVRMTQAAVLLALLGRKQSLELVLDALDKVDLEGKGLIAMDLGALPASAEVSEAFQKTYEGLPLDVQLSSDRHGVAALLHAAPTLFAPELVPWMVAATVDLRGDDTELAPFREEALASALFLFGPDQTAEVDRLAALITPEKYEKDYRLAKELVANCKKDAACYLAALAKSGAAPDAGFAAVKAATMIGLYATESDKAAIAERLPRIRSGDARRMLVLALLRLCPDGDVELANRLDRALDETALADATVTMAVARLRSRAES